jgi:pimeloyl-ACP methyl ester carboxylesterase
MMLLALALLASDHFIDFKDGAKIHYTSDGPAMGPAIVQIHGWTCNATFFRMQTAEFAKHYRVISVDLPGHGRSDAPRGVSYTIEHFAEAVSAVIKHAGVDKAVIIGHSMGVPVAVKAAQDNPTVATGIVAIDGPVWTTPRKPQQPVSPWMRDLERNYKSVATKYIETMFVFTTPIFLKAEIRRKMLLTPPHVGVNAMIVMGESDVYLRGKTKLPVLAVMAGRRTNDDRRAAHQDAFPNLRYEVWEEAGHFLMMEQPDRFNRLVLDFIAPFHTVN